MDLFLSAVLLLLFFAVAAVLGRHKGKKTANNVINLVNAREEEWKKRGLSEDEINKHLQICFGVIMSLKVTDFTAQEYLDRCKSILDDEEEFIFLIKNNY